MGEYAVEMLHITKKFPGIVANDDITLQLKKGEIHALLGENGAGKSTLMSVLFGLYQAEEGEIRKDGKKVEIKNPNDANAPALQTGRMFFRTGQYHTRLRAGSGRFSEKRRSKEKGDGAVKPVSPADRTGCCCGKYYSRDAAENGNPENAVPGQ